MIVIACPGQGSQTPGFLNPWLELPGARDFLGEASEHAGADLIAHGTVSDAETIRDTAIAQPLIVAASLLAWRELSARVDLAAAGIAGHSVGEFAAASAAGILGAGDALRLVGVRGRAMAEAAARAETGMAAVVGGVEDDVLAQIAAHGLTPANRNGGGQIVAAGERSALAALAEDAPRGARVIPLQVAGAFHTEAMSSAIPALREAAAAVAVADPAHTIWSNADGSVVTEGKRFLELLVSQVANPVRWDACMAGFAEHGIGAFIELAPAGALTGIAKRALKGVPSAPISSPSDLDAAVALISEAA
ncbi:ACP S-malonyltransferase [Leucobacter massiliensis]|uniref:[acyl-carrier-protein] S-malonyltransferase n=1 Tax=Leucobacter massiliensis TaxID=1686285 RepID=A0A2S9QRG9_9MICO|nr:ACP S-malonyltransferase [Leucobacter massiliensis]PRI12184.1 ACP S-malonyltransferase [Leucobacter massiliensis]